MLRSIDAHAQTRPQASPDASPAAWRAVFRDFALTSARVLRAVSDEEELAGTLRATLQSADLRRVEALSGDKLRAALVVAMGERSGGGGDGHG